MRYLLICSLFISLAWAETKPSANAVKTPPAETPVPMSPEEQKPDRPVKLLLVSAPEFVGVKNENLKLFMSKIAIDVLMRTNQYQLVFTLSKDSLKTKLQTFRLDLGVSTTDEQSYNLKFDVTDISNKKVISSATAQNVPRRLLLLQTRMSLYELFLGKSYVEKNLKKIDLEDQKKKLPPEAEADSARHEEEKNKMNSKDGSQQKKKDRNGEKVSSNRVQKKSQDDLEIEKNQLLQEEAKLEDEKVIKNRLDEIKKMEHLAAQIKAELMAEQHLTKEDDIAHSATTAASADKTQSAATSASANEKATANKNDHAALNSTDKGTIKADQKGSLNSSSSEKKLAAESATNTRPTEAPRYNYRALPSSFLLEVEFMSRTITSTYFLTIINNLSYMGPKLTYRKEFFESNHDAYILSLSNLKSVKSKDEEAMQLPPIIDFDLLYDKAFQFMPLDILLGLSFERSYFINMETPGKGYKLSKNDWLWLKVGPEIGHKIFFIDYYIQLYYAKILSGKSDFLGNNQLKFDGNKYGVGFDLGLYGSLRVGAKMEKDTITATTDSKFTLTQNSFLFRATYVF